MVNYQSVMTAAEQKCLHQGIKFTKRRKQVLSVLIEADVALSAYEIAERCNAGSDSNMPAMSVYRILDLFQEQNLIHKLDIANKYVCCAHISCSHEHDNSQFLICGSCRHVEEISLSDDAVQALQTAASAVGFNAISPQLEIKGRCSRCEHSEGHAITS
ncbi:MAG: transcriptional repressor [Halieaceae bacterium]|nr:transcriptional repressor [Halieaceae bacterium]